MSDFGRLYYGARRTRSAGRLLLLQSAMALALWVGTEAGHAQVTATKSVSVTIQPTTTALPLVVADKKGMFAKHNIAVKWSVSQVPISDSISTLGRQFDVMMGTQPALIAASGQGIPIVCITGGGLDTAKIPTSNIVARAGSGITTFKQLEGKTVGTLTLTGNIHFALLNILQKEGVNLDSIRWVTGTVPQLPDLLRVGRVDAIEEIEPFAIRSGPSSGRDDSTGRCRLTSVSERLDGHGVVKPPERPLFIASRWRLSVENAESSRACARASADGLRYAPAGVI